MRISLPCATKGAAIAISAIYMCGSGLQAAEQCQFEISDQAVSIWLKDVTGLTNIDERLLQKQLLNRAPFVTCRWKASEMQEGKSRLNSYKPRSIVSMAWTKDVSREVKYLVITALGKDKSQSSPGLPEEIVGNPYQEHESYTLVPAAKDLAVFCTKPSAFQGGGWGYGWPDRLGEQKDFGLQYIQHPSGSYVSLGDVKVLRYDNKFWRHGFTYLDDRQQVVNHAIPNTSDNDSSFVADCSKNQAVSFSGTIDAAIEDRKLVGIIKKYVKLRLVKSLRSGTPSFKF